MKPLTYFGDINERKATVGAFIILPLNFDILFIVSRPCHFAALPAFLSFTDFCLFMADFRPRAPACHAILSALLRKIFPAFQKRIFAKISA